MNVNVSECLIKARENHGYSEEELANKLGVGVDTIKDWESGKVSPTTDNLIAIANLYEMSLDELLGIEKKEKVHLVDDDGSEVVIDNEKVTIKDKDGNVIDKKNWSKVIVNKINMLESGLMLIAIVSYILLGCFAHMWYNGWVFLFVPAIICSALRAINKKNANKFSIESLVMFAYFFLCMVMPGLDAQLWHPLWLIFFIIPLYHLVVSYFTKKD